MLDINWTPLPCAVGYNIYSRSSKKSIKERRKINKNFITSGNHFAFIWEFKNGKRKKSIKGYEHIISIEAICSTETRHIFSPERDNLYFEGFRNIIDSSSVKKILVSSQKKSPLSDSIVVNSSQEFISFMETIGRYLHKIVSDSINPLEIGGCAPITTIVIKTLKAAGLTAYKAEGLFIKEYHSFVIINLDNCEYILDFTADQFIPNVSPVLIPRDFCNLNEHGKLSKIGKPIYKIGKLYKEEDIFLKQTENGQIYNSIKNSIFSKFFLNKNNSDSVFTSEL